MQVEHIQPSRLLLVIHGPNIAASSSFSAMMRRCDMVNTASNVFADLYPYLDADPELGRDSFLPNMLDGLTTNGELHALYNSTEIISLSALEKYVGDGKNLSIDDYRRIIAENDELAAMFGPWTMLITPTAPATSTMTASKRCLSGAAK